MTREQFETFKAIAEQCKDGNYGTINVASKIRSEAVVAAYKLLSELAELNTKLNTKNVDDIISTLEDTLEDNYISEII